MSNALWRLNILGIIIYDSNLDHVYTQGGRKSASSSNSALGCRWTCLVSDLCWGLGRSRRRILTGTRTRLSILLDDRDKSGWRNFGQVRNFRSYKRLTVASAYHFKLAFHRSGSVGTQLRSLYFLLRHDRLFQSNQVPLFFCTNHNALRHGLAFSGCSCLQLGNHGWHCKQSNCFACEYNVQRILFA